MPSYSNGTESGAASSRPHRVPKKTGKERSDRPRKDFAGDVTNRPRTGSISAASQIKASMPTRIYEPPSVYQLAAEAILRADFILIAAGAGFSADSGLPVYKDIADIAAYRHMKVTYSDLCDPAWIKRDPEVFFGFWGNCFNTYMTCLPHEGYVTLRRWKQTLFNGRYRRPISYRRPSAGSSDSAGNGRPTMAELPGRGPEAGERPQQPWSRDLALAERRSRRRMDSGPSRDVTSPDRREPRDIPASSLAEPRGPRDSLDGRPRRSLSVTSPTTMLREGIADNFVEDGKGGSEGSAEASDEAKEAVPIPDVSDSFFIYTSNVDTAFTKAGFFKKELLEIHGNIVQWQCSRPCRTETFQIPPTYRFEVDPLTMRAPMRRTVPPSQSKPSPPSTHHPSPNPANGVTSPPNHCPSVTSPIRTRPVPVSAFGPRNPIGTFQATQGLASGECSGSLILNPQAKARQSPPGGVASEASCSRARDPTSPPPAAPRVTPQPEPTALDPESDLPIGHDRTLNHVFCRFCGLPARPNILMFDDDRWIPVAEAKYRRWERRVKKALKQDAMKRLVILEAGCGLRVPTVRMNSERLLSDTLSRGTTLIRINPDFPNNKRSPPERTISIRDSALPALKSIDNIVQQKMLVMSRAPPYGGLSPSSRTVASF